MTESIGTRSCSTGEMVVVGACAALATTMIVLGILQAINTITWHPTISYALPIAGGTGFAGLAIYSCKRNASSSTTEVTFLPADLAWPASVSNHYRIAITPPSGSGPQKRAVIHEDLTTSDFLRNVAREFPPPAGKRIVLSFRGESGTHTLESSLLKTTMKDALKNETSGVDYFGFELSFV